MKNIRTKTVTLIAAIAFLAISALNANGLNISAAAGFESERFDDGKQIASNVATTNLQLGYDPVYAGVTAFWNLEKLDAAVSHEVDFAVGAKFQNVLVDKLTLDAGGLVKWYPESNKDAGETDYTLRPYVGIVYGIFLKPSVYVSYDINKQQFGALASVSEAFVYPACPKVSLVPKIFVGYINANDVLPNAAKQEAQYVYGGASVDLVYAFSDNFNASVGGRYAYNRDDGDTNDNLYWGAALNYKF